VSPALPAGLSLNAATGTISGTPTAATPLATYTITASNAGGSTTATIGIGVYAQAPAISYGIGRFTFKVSSASQTVVPSNTGGAVVSWTISPALSDGLGFNASTGVISGTPTALAPPSAYA